MKRFISTSFVLICSIGTKLSAHKNVRVVNGNVLLLDYQVRVDGLMINDRRQRTNATGTLTVKA